MLRGYSGCTQPPFPDCYAQPDHLKTPEQIWKDCCEASADIRTRHGLKAAIDYLVARS